MHVGHRPVYALILVAGVAAAPESPGVKRINPPALSKPRLARPEFLIEIEAIAVVGK